MKTRIFLVAGAIVGSLALPSIAGATDCSITNTGPGSNNNCTSNNTDTCTTTNNNNIDINNNNQQTGTSGSASNNGNTNGGSANTGGASNNNSTSVTGTIDNTGACGTGTPVVPVTPTQPSGGNGGGQVESAQTTAPQVQAPVGGVAAGEGSTDRSGLLVGLLGASVAAIGVGLRTFRFQKQA